MAIKFPPRARAALPAQAGVDSYEKIQPAPYETRTPLVSRRIPVPIFPDSVERLRPYVTPYDKRSAGLYRIPKFFIQNAPPSRLKARRLVPEESGWYRSSYFGILIRTRQLN